MMKLVGVCVCVFAFLFFGCMSADRSTTASRPENSPFPVLDEYGYWLSDPALGYVWHPNVGYDWRPFSEGRWMWTDRGWMWASDEPFGWVVYHYGYWDHHGPAGWVWVPGYEWSPARVEWYGGENYVGWAPLPPPGIQLPEAYVPAGENVWTVVPSGSFTKRGVGHYRTNFTAADNSGGRSNNVHRPPEPGVIERQTHEQISPVRIQTESIPVGGRKLLRVTRTDENVRPKEPPTPVVAPKVVPPPTPAPVIQPVPKQPPPQVQPNRIAPVTPRAQGQIDRRAKRLQKQARPNEKNHQPEKADTLAAPNAKSLRRSPPERPKKIEEKVQVK